METAFSRVFVYVSEDVDEFAVEQALKQIEGRIHFVTLNETVQDSMVFHIAKKNGVQCLSFPKGENITRDMELLDYCDGMILIGDNKKLRWFLSLGKMMRRKVAWFDKKGRYNG